MAKDPLFVFSSLLLALAPSLPAANIISQQSFDNVGALAGAGWMMINNSSPTGNVDWFQGNPSVFHSQSGGDDSYIAASFNNAAFGGNISNWLLSPIIWVTNGDTLRFATRTEPGSTVADRLEVRLSTRGSSSNVGSSDSSVGDFGTLLLSVNPALDSSGYPANWTFFTATVSGIRKPGSGRLAFRYAVTDTSVNGNYIGIDSATLTQVVPEPSTIALIGLGFVLMAAWRMRRARTIGLSCAALLLAVCAYGDSVKKDKEKDKSAPAAAKSGTAVGGGSVVAVDPKTHKIRQPEREEIEALQPVQKAAAARSGVVVNRLPDGSESVKLDDRFESFSVVTKNADGTLSTTCVQGRDAAKKAMNAPASTKPAKEAANAQ